jgi:carbon-monoxide dehydrogenase small subunit
MKTVTMIVNGRTEKLTLEPHRTLLDVLREDLGLTGAKRGCEAGECGACTVILNGRPVNSCLVLAVELDGAEVLTIEGLGGQSALDPMQQSFIDNFALQCGYCTPGMILMGKSLLTANPHPSEDEVKEYISGNLCRCTGYENIVKAIMAVAREVSAMAEHRVLGKACCARRGRQGHRGGAVRGRHPCSAQLLLCFKILRHPTLMRV